VGSPETRFVHLDHELGAPPPNPGASSRGRSNTGKEEGNTLQERGDLLLLCSTSSHLGCFCKKPQPIGLLHATSKGAVSRRQSAGLASKSLLLPSGRKKKLKGDPSSAGTMCQGGAAGRGGRWNGLRGKKPPRLAGGDRLYSAGGAYA